MILQVELTLFIQRQHLDEIAALDVTALLVGAPKPIRDHEALLLVKRNGTLIEQAVVERRIIG